MSLQPEDHFDELGRLAYLLTTIAADTTRAELEFLCRKEHITIAQYPVLWTLYLSEQPGGLAMSEISDGMVTKTSDVTRLVDRLVQGGLVTRSQSANDRRKIMVAITNEGRAVFERVTPEIKFAHREQFGHLSDRELKQFIKTLNKIIWRGEKGPNE